MGTHPSKKFENGVLTERAISTDVAGDPDEQDAHTEAGHRITAESNDSTHRLTADPDAFCTVTSV